MESNVQGAWIIHHTDKLTGITNQNDFGNIYFSGKCGMLLSALAESSNTSTLSNKKIEAIAKATGINIKFELPQILEVLSNEKLIDLSKSGDVAVLGLTTSSVLQHVSTFFEETKPNSFEKAVLEMAELTSS